jgi:transposase
VCGPGPGGQGVVLKKDPGLSLRQRGIKATIPEPSTQRAARIERGRGRNGGRPPAFDAALHKKRNVAERAIGKLRAVRAVATRDD